MLRLARPGIIGISILTCGGSLDVFFFFSSRRRHTRFKCDWSSDVCSSDLICSTRSNYHVQFERVLQMGSYDELVARMHEKAGPVASAEATAATASAVRAMVAAPAPLGPPPIGVATPAPASPMAATVLAELREPGAIANDATPRRLAAPLPVASVTRSPTAIAGASAPPRRQFWVQAGAFRSADAATRLVPRPRRHPVRVPISTDRLAPLARVLVGPFVERSAAVSAVRALEASGIAAFIADTPE